jgi:hypothetical protein
LPPSRLGGILPAIPHDKELPMRRTVLALVVLAGLAGCGEPPDELFRQALRQRRPAPTAALPARAAQAAPADADAEPMLFLATEMGPALAAGDAAASSAQPDADAADADAVAAAAEKPDLPYVPRRQRRGPAYPGDFWRSFGRDAKELPAMIWDDTVAAATDPGCLLLLAGAGVTGITLSGRGGNDQVEAHFTKHGHQLNKFWDLVGDVGGNPGTHFALAGALYFGSLARGDDRNYEVAKSMLSALSINGALTLALKGMAHTESPNGDENGWPSGHTSSSFCFASVLHRHYGPWVGIPLYLGAAYVGYERIDARNHDFHDVISGALIGLAIGHAVAAEHQPKVLGMDVLPYADPRGGAGLALYKRW